jgi:penicillin-binding protein 1B
LVGSGAAFAWLSVPFWKLRSGLTAGFEEPSRLWEQPPRIERGSALRAGDLVAALERRGYREELSSGPAVQPAVGHYRMEGEQLEVHLRSFPRPAGPTSPVILGVDARGGRVRRLALAGEPVPVAVYDPLRLVTFYDDRFIERRQVRLSELPRHVMLAVLAAEDTGFFNHPGLSLSGIGRALWVNLRDREIEQGGSTLTQQLVKNRVLTHDRTVVRKLREAVVSVLVELRFSKTEILEAYLNEIFLGRSAGINVVGIGAAARTYYGVPAEELTLAESASLAAMIRAPASLAPHVDPEANRQRRDQLLARLFELEWIDQEQLRTALAEEPPLAPQLSRDVARYAADAVAAEIEARYQIGRDALEHNGLDIVSTLVAAEQAAAEAIVVEELDRLDQGLQEADERRLQAALVALEPRSGAITAWVGGRDYRASQFDRVRQAHRQVGSAFKPVVLAAALSERTVTVADRLLDEPLTVRLAGNTWRPQNDNRQWSGEVSVREVFERSLNVPTVRLALDVGLDNVVRWARRLGVTSRLADVPSLALGAFEMTPLELARVYATFAAGGMRPPMHLVEGVLDRSGQSLQGEALAEPELVLDEGVSYLVTSVLEGVVQHGTGQGVRRAGLMDLVAAKSGTSNDGRDSWFVGYAKQRSTLVWVGYDQGGGTRLSGARGALPIWSRFMLAIRPSEGFSVMLPPASVRTATIDPETGFLAAPRCPQVATESFLEGQVPGEECWVHGGRRERQGFWKRLLRRGRTDSP